MNEELTERQAFLVLNALPHIGPVTMNRLLAVRDGDPRAVLAARRGDLLQVRGVGPVIGDVLARWREHVDLAREEQRLRQAQAQFLTVRDADYPRLLREIHDPPIGLYRKGTYDLAAPTVAIVGSRRTTLYGQATARRLAAELAAQGFCVVSGLARGIDTAAHEGALSVGGRTAAVLGTGIDLVYPPENLDLYRRIEAAGAILSEFPFGRRADKQSFAMRNRIVSGMAEAVVVVETDVNGGSMITARFAGEQGRQVFAVPGRIDQASSRGCHQLIRDGAILLTGVEDLLSELHYLGGHRPAAVARVAPADAPAALTVDERAVYTHLADGACLSPETLAERTGRPVGAVSGMLLMLELKRWVSKRADGTYEGRGGALPEDEEKSSKKTRPSDTGSSPA